MNASGRRQQALTVVSGAILALVALRALPRPPEPPSKGNVACSAPARVVAAPMTASHLRCDGAGDAVSGNLRLLAGHPVQLNLASPRELSDLPGIGEKTAQRIVDHRAAHGPFPSVDALEGVRGIGPKTVQRLRPFIAAP